MSTLEKQKDVYKLWVDYLKESPNYAECCKANEGGPVKQNESILADGMARRISVAKGRKRLIPLQRMYDVFGDIRAQTPAKFDEWWDNKMVPLLEERADETAIELVGKDNIGQFVAEIRDKLRVFGEQGEDAIADSIKQILCNHFCEKDGSVCLRISTYYPQAKLKAQFVDIIESYKERYRVTNRKERQFLNLLAPEPYPKLPTREQIEACKEYLAIYTAKKPGITWEDVLRQLAPECMTDNGILPEKDYLRTDFITFHGYAERLIRNAERGLFPGYYRKKTPKK